MIVSTFFRILENAPRLITRTCSCANALPGDSKLRHKHQPERESPEWRVRGLMGDVGDFIIEYKEKHASISLYPETRKAYNCNAAFWSMKTLVLCLANP